MDTRIRRELFCRAEDKTGLRIAVMRVCEYRVYLQASGQSGEVLVSERLETCGGQDVLTDGADPNLVYVYTYAGQRELSRIWE